MARGDHQMAIIFKRGTKEFEKITCNGQDAVENDPALGHPAPRPGDTIFSLDGDYRPGHGQMGPAHVGPPFTCCGIIGGNLYYWLSPTPCT
jgi:hypothetical protein